MNSKTILKYEANPCSGLGEVEKVKKLMTKTMMTTWSHTHSLSVTKKIIFSKLSSHYLGWPRPVPSWGLPSNRCIRSRYSWWHLPCGWGTPPAYRMWIWFAAPAIWGSPLWHSQIPTNSESHCVNAARYRPSIPLGSLLGPKFRNLTPIVVLLHWYINNILLDWKTDTKSILIPFYC